MADIKNEYGTSNQSITCTINSLGSTNLRQSAVVDNTSNVFIDALVVVKIQTGLGPTNNSQVRVYAYGTADGGTSYTSKASGSDAAYGSGSGERKENLRYLGTITVNNTNGVSYTGGPWSVKAAFDGELPQKWGIVVENDTGVTLDSSGNSAHYQGVYRDVA